jgi:raffinose/stachyose/melibiose transport system permease protein
LLRSERVAGSLFLAPALAIYLTIIVYPMIYSAYLSLFEWDGISPTKHFVGFGNYRTLWSENRVFWIALKNNALWTAVALTVPTALGLGLALVLNRPSPRAASTAACSTSRPSCR